MSVTGTLSANSISSATSISANGNAGIVSAGYAVRSKRFSLEKSNNTYENVLTVSNDKTLLSSDIAEIKTLKVYDTAYNVFREFELKVVGVTDVNSGGTVPITILAKKE